jgi:hypothetical protein
MVTASVSLLEGEADFGSRSSASSLCITTITRNESEEIAWQKSLAFEDAQCLRLQINEIPI